MNPPTRIALTRAVSAAIVHCELTHLARSPIDPIRASEQHERYEQLLESLGCVVQRVEPAPDLPDAVFIEDTAIVLPEIAIIARPGAPSRRLETPAVADALRSFRNVVDLPARSPDGALPTIDGGDVLVIGHTIFVGGSLRSNDAGRAALHEIVRPFGYDVVRIDMRDCLHLKTAATLVAPDTLVVNPQWVDARTFAVARVIEVDPAEPFASNALCVGDAVIHDVAHTHTRKRLEAAGLDVRVVDSSELAKAEGGVTCCSILLDHFS